MEEAPERRKRHPRASSHRDAYTDIQVELTRLAFHGLAGTVIVSSVGMISGAIILGIHYQDPWLLNLIWVMVVSCSLRLATVFAFHRRAKRPIDATAARHWELAYGITLFSSTSLVAITTLHNFRVNGPAAVYWSTVGVFATASGVSSRIALRPWIANSAGGVALLSLAIGLLMSPDRIQRLSLILVAFFAYAYFSSVQVKFATVVDQLRARRKLLELSEQDSLTGLANRRRFHALLEQASGRAYAILYLDLDRFKAVNDTFGHAAGDALLQAVAERLKLAVRSGDVVARLGGDEFAILQSADATQANAEALAARITESIARPYMIRGDTVGVGVSVGICPPTEAGFDTDRAMKIADKALYVVKQRGGGAFLTASA